MTSYNGVRAVEEDRTLVFRHGRGLTATERTGLEELRSRLELWLRPASIDAVRAELVGPLDLVRARRDEPGSELIVAAQYSEALHGRAIGALKAARVAINRNEAPFVEPHFMPNPTELAREVQRQSAPALIGLSRIERLLAAKEQPPPPSPEERARVLRSIEEFRRPSRTPAPAEASP